MNMRIEYFIAEESNLEEVKKLFEEYADSLGIDLGFQDFKDEVDTLPDKYAQPEGAILLAKCESEVAGCVALKKIDARICEMKRLYVRPRFRKFGIGRELVARILAEGNAKGYDTMRLDTLPTMNRAQALYRSFGFYEIAPYVFNPVAGAVFMEAKIIPARLPAF